MRPICSGLPLSLAALTLLAGSLPLWADEADNKPATLIIRLPADAELTIGGKKCKQTGETREFDTPPLPPGKKFSYTVKAVWTEDGQEKTYIARAVVRAGETTRIDVLRPPPPKVAEGPKKPDKPPEDKKPPTEPEEDRPVPEPVAKGPELEAGGSFKLEVAGTRVSLKPGETGLLTVRVRRDHFKEPVQLRFTGVPAKVAVEKAMLAGDEERAHVQVSAADDAPASETVIGVIASGGKVTAEGSFKLLVVRPEEPKQAPAAALTFHAPQTLTLEPGQKKLLPVKVIRSHFQGPVTVKLEGLPPGVEVSEATVPADKDKVYLAASAADGAEAMECQARLVGTSGKVRHEVPLTVRVGGK